MPSPETSDVTQILSEISRGERSAVDRLFPVVYDELRRVAGILFRRESTDHTLQPTALVNEAFVRLVDQDRVQWQGRSHFFGVGAQAMRRILVDHARGKLRQKRGGTRSKVLLKGELALSLQSDHHVLAVDEAFTKLAELDSRQARIVELRFFAGLTVQEVAEVLGVSKRTVEAEWTIVRAWLRRELSDEAEP